MSALGIPYNLVFPEDGLLGEEISPGNWTGMMGLIQRGEADLAFTHLPINYQRTKLVDFSRYYCMEEYTFVSQYPETTKSAFTFLHPFNLPIWTCIIVSLVIVSVCFAMLKNGTRSVQKHYFNSSPSIVGQPLDVGRNSLKCNILITFLGVLCKIYPLLLYFDFVVVSYTASERISDTKFP
ncbi:uncharacterized protein CEXT_633251 [Caerostris extrusa]|uniref:Ionotropic glutamate receptor L-glutamate and glycine-binding domain-containing protein n=1 Tax=Caerostris extrusa TaxID=172846 RepID=A0AAV4N187_CAEEX|nr:uncharacterized protein CEXT_633251 [Caerostris extrusa]